MVVTMSLLCQERDHVSLSTEQTLESFTGNRETILKSLNQLVDEIYERIRRQRYEFKTVGVNYVKSDFSIETRETSFSNFHNKRESIASVIEGLLDRFFFCWFKHHHHHHQQQQ